jgi:hypothetical protein
VVQGATTTESYSYEAVDNRLSSLGVSPYNYNPSHELISSPSGSSTHDASGNTLTESDSLCATRTHIGDYQTGVANGNQGITHGLE